jgi:transcriptional regulator of arginine metabolism
MLKLTTMSNNTKQTNDSQARLSFLKKILIEGIARTQEEICDVLKEKNFSVTQSTVSRDLRRIGALRSVSSEGKIVYKLSEDVVAQIPNISSSLKDLILKIDHNGSMVVIRTPAGSASLVALQLDSYKPKSVLGTLAGDDTIFIAPVSAKKIDVTYKEILKILGA